MEGGVGGERHYRRSLLPHHVVDGTGRYRKAGGFKNVGGPRGFLARPGEAKRPLETKVKVLEAIALGQGPVSCGQDHGRYRLNEWSGPGSAQRLVGVGT